MIDMKKYLELTVKEKSILKDFVSEFVNNRKKPYELVEAVFLELLQDPLFAIDENI